MEHIHVIKKPLLTEKSTFTSDEFKRYMFLVDSRASKTEIKDAIQDLYKVRVLDVNTHNRRERNRRYRYGFIEGKSTKRAVVRVHPDDTIELF
jgi:large subunit ribosomal protein L23